MAIVNLQQGSAPAKKNKTRLELAASLVSPVAAAILVGVLFFIAPNLNRLDMRILSFIFMWVALTSSWNLIGGYTGYVDFGHSVFVGVGGYIAGILMARLGILQGISDVASQRDVLWSFGQVLPLAFIGGGLFAVLVGYPTLRLKGPYFSIAMLGVLVAMREIVRNDIQINGNGLTNGGIGISFLAPFARPQDIYYLMLVLAASIFFISLWMYRVQIGKMLKAIRDDELGADTRGINTTALKIGIFMLAGGFTAMVGCTKAYWDGYIDPDTIFPRIYHIEIIMMTMLGGIGRPWGPVFGAVLFYYGQTTIWAQAGEQHLLITGAMLIAIMLLMPGGILSLLDPEDRGLDWFIRSRILRQKERIFDDNDKFKFREIPGDSAKGNSAKAKRNLPKNDAPIVLEGRNISKDFGGLRAVDGVNVEIRQGEIVALLGPNGSGKTSLFNCLSGVLKLTSGSIWVNGKDVTRQAPWRINRAGLSRTFQRLRVYRKQRVYDNLLLARRWQGIPAWLWLQVAPLEVRTKADDLMNFLKLSHVSNNLAENLSGGQQRLLEIGMSLMNDPAVVLLDEATSGVNPALVDEIKEDILRLNQERDITFFLIEHNMSFAMDLASRIYVLDYGQLIAHGTAEEIQSNQRVIEAYFGQDG